MTDSFSFVKQRVNCAKYNEVSKLFGIEISRDNNYVSLTYCRSLDLVSEPLFITGYISICRKEHRPSQYH